VEERSAAASDEATRPLGASLDRLVGLRPVAFEVDTAAEVDAANERCVGQGTNIHFPPEEDRDVEGYYAFFVFDPDGMRIEIFSWPRSDVKEFC
jgi:catechol 2,3-dioxygenase-like lactoylglutathione lyase family enzyme